MELNDYQEKAMATCMESSNNLAYMLTGLTAEVGEVNDKIAKAIRKGIICMNNNSIEIGSNIDDGLKAEVADCLWFIAGLCKVMGWSLEEVAQSNIDKLASRKERNVIDGNGDDR